MEHILSSNADKYLQKYGCEQSRKESPDCCFALSSFKFFFHLKYLIFTKGSNLPATPEKVKIKSSTPEFKARPYSNVKHLNNRKGNILPLFPFSGKPLNLMISMQYREAEAQKRDKELHKNRKNRTL